MREKLEPKSFKKEAMQDKSTNFCSTAFVSDNFTTYQMHSIFSTAISKHRVGPAPVALKHICVDPAAATPRQLWLCRLLPLAKVLRKLCQWPSAATPRQLWLCRLLPMAKSRFGHFLSLTADGVQQCPVRRPALCLQCIVQPIKPFTETFQFSIYLSFRHSKKPSTCLQDYISKYR